MNPLKRLSFEYWHHFLIGQFQLHWVQIALAAGQAAMSLYGAHKKKKAAGDAKIPEMEKIDPLKIADTAHKADLTGIERSIAAEKKYSPETFKFRQGSTEALMDLINLPGAGSDLEGRIRGLGMDTPQMSTQVGSGNLALANQRALEELQLGGALPKDVANMIARRSMSQAGSVGIQGGQAGRDLVARDLGISSLDLLNQRMQRSQMFGAAEQGRLDDINRFNIGLETTMPMQSAQMLESLTASRTGRGLDLSRFGHSIERPKIGLSGTEMANLEIAKVNQANQAKIAMANAQNAKAAAKQGGMMDMLGAGSNIMGMFQKK